MVPTTRTPMGGGRRSRRGGGAARRGTPRLTRGAGARGLVGPPRWTRSPGPRMTGSVIRPASFPAGPADAPPRFGRRCHASRTRHSAMAAKEARVMNTGWRNARGGAPGEATRAHLVRELAAQRGVRAQAEEGGPARARREPARGAELAEARLRGGTRRRHRAARAGGGGERAGGECGGGARDGGRHEGPEAFAVVGAFSREKAHVPDSPPARRERGRPASSDDDDDTGRRDVHWTSPAGPRIRTPRPARLRAEPHAPPVPATVSRTAIGGARGAGSARSAGSDVASRGVVGPRDPRARPRIARPRGLVRDARRRLGSRVPIPPRALGRDDAGRRGPPRGRARPPRGGPPRRSDRALGPRGGPRWASAAACSRALFGASDGSNAAPSAREGARGSSLAAGALEVSSSSSTSALSSAAKPRGRGASGDAEPWFNPEAFTAEKRQWLAQRRRRRAAEDARTKAARRIKKKTPKDLDPRRIEPSKGKP